METQNKECTQTGVKKLVASNLKKMGIGESFVFPLIQVTTIRVTIQRLKMTTDYRFSTVSDLEQNILTVTRTA